MFFARDVKADYSTPGLSWKYTKNGGIKGRIYTTLPIRLKRSFKKAAVIGFIWMIFTTNTELPDDMFFAASFSNFFDGAFVSYLFFVVWPFWPLQDRGRAFHTWRQTICAAGYSRLSNAAQKLHAGKIRRSSNFQLRP